MAKTIINKLDWDSKFFKLKIGKIKLDTNILPPDLSQNIINENYDLIYIFIQGEQPLNSQMGKLVDIKYTYYKDISEFKKNQIDSNIRKITHSSEVLYNLALQSGHISRYKKDTNFKTDDFEKLYKKWIDNSVNNIIADYIIGYYLEKNLIGFISLKINIDYGEIGLFAVDFNYRGQGIVKKLIEAAEFFSSVRGCKELIVVTQKENKQACNFYTSNGFNLREKETIYHNWIKQHDTF